MGKWQSWGDQRLVPCWGLGSGYWGFPGEGIWAGADPRAPAGDGRAKKHHVHGESNPPAEITCWAVGVGAARGRWKRVGAVGLLWVAGGFLHRSRYPNFPFVSSSGPFARPLRAAGEHLHAAPPHQDLLPCQGETLCSVCTPRAPSLLGHPAGFAGARAAPANLPAATAVFFFLLQSTTSSPRASKCQMRCWKRRRGRM